MRIRHRLTAFVPLLVTLMLVTEARAQSMMGFPSSGIPTFLQPPGSQPGGGSGVSPSILNQGVPLSSFQQYPGVSPFEQTFEQHFNSDGLWFKRLLGPLSGRTKMYFNLDYVRTKTRGLTGMVGNPSAATFAQLEIESGGTGRFPEALSLNHFGTANTNIIPSLVNNGIMVSGGMRNPTGWGVAWDFTWNGKSQAKYDARAGYEATRPISTVDALLLEAADGEGMLTTSFNSFDERQLAIQQILTVSPITDGLATTFPFFGDAEDILDRVLWNLHGIPLDNNVADEPGGAAQRFDLDFIMTHRIETFDTGAYFTSNPIYESELVTVRPLVGGRFVRVDESFHFFGMDSGLDYEANIADGVDDDDDWIVDNVDENGTATFEQGNPSVQSLSVSFIDSIVQSSMAGPELGFEYTFGDNEGIQVTGSTRVGAFANQERITLIGDNIVDTLSFIPNPNPDPNNPNDPTDILDDGFDTTRVNGALTANSFTDAKTSTHISPVFRQTLTAEIPIFSRVPVLKDIWQLQGAKFRAGFTYLWIGEVADPQQSINYVSNPRQQNLFPHLQIRRSSFFQNQFNIGINWEY